MTPKVALRLLNIVIRVCPKFLLTTPGVQRIPLWLLKQSASELTLKNLSTLMKG